jgi:uncharacterized protein YecT (DUF1311 family)
LPQIEIDEREKGRMAVMAPRRFAIAAVLVMGCCSSLPPSATPRTLDWHPDLDQPIRQLHEVLDATEQQQPRNYTAANLAFVLDAKLYLLFQQYLQGIPGDRRNPATEEQRTWLSIRAAETDRAYSEYQGGTLASFSGSEAFIKVTQDRITELSRRMNALTTGPVP